MLKKNFQAVLLNQASSAHIYLSIHFRLCCCYFSILRWIKKNLKNNHKFPWIFQIICIINRSCNVTKEVKSVLNESWHVSKTDPKNEWMMINTCFHSKIAVISVITKHSNQCFECISFSSSSRRDRPVLVFVFIIHSR